MFAAALHRSRKELQAARLCAAVSHAVEPLEARVMFASGDVDVMFGGGDGVVTQNFFNRNDFGFSVAVQADQKVVVAGWVTTGTSTGNDVAVMRYNADGTLDTSFGGGDGIVTTHLGSTSDAAFSVAVQSDGKIVVGGQARGTTTLNDFAVVRYLADGSLDTSFGVGGIVKTDLNGGASDTAAAMTLMADGKIVLVGSTVMNLENSFAAVRYTSSGQLDTSFGTNGVAIARYGNGPSSAKSVAAMADGSVVLGGTLTDFAAADSDFAAIHLLSDGSLDTAFGADGWARVNGGGDTEVANAVVAMPDGRVMLAGQSLQAGHLDFAVVRLTAAGQADVAFGVNGVVHHSFAGGGDGTVFAALMQADGRLLVAGNALVDGTNRLALAHYNVDGSLDSNFGAGGMASVAVGIDARGKGVALDGQSRILVVGNAHNAANFDFVLARLENHVNAPPVAHAGGPYIVVAGSSVVLDGSGSSDAEGALVSYEWDMNYDGSSFDVDASGVAPSFSSSVAGAHTVALRVTDADGASHVVTTTVTVLLAPTAHAGGPYSVMAGGSLVLDGSASSDADGSLVSYEWDFNYDGSSFDVDGSGMSPSFDSTGLSGVRTVALRVTDNDGLVHLVTTTLNVMVPPTASAGGPYTVTAGNPLVLDGSGSGDADGSIVSYEWDMNYDGSSFDVDATGMNPSFNSTGLSGVRTVALRVTDNDGHVHLVTTTVTVNVPPPPPPPVETPRGPAFLVEDPSQPGKKMLVVSGSGRSERIRFNVTKKGVEVRIGRTSAGVFSGMTRIVVHGNGGNDIIDAHAVTLPVALFGGAGNDKLVGTKFGDILVGGDGDDTLDGGKGDDLMVGGLGRDMLLSKLGNDMMVAGSLAVGDDLPSLVDVLAAWAQSAASSSKKSAARPSNVAMVVDDGVKDTLFGTPGVDAMHTGAGDQVVKLGK